MATNELKSPVQPVQDPQTEVMEAPTDVDAAIPPHKSGVYIDPFAVDQTRKFQKGDIVHMAIIDRGVRTKGVFKVHKARLHSSRSYVEYQLFEADGRLFNNGVWVRERDLKMEKAKR